MTAKTEDKAKKKRKGKSISHGNMRTIIDGRVVSIELFKRHGWFILIAVVSIIALIGQRYSNLTKLERIKELNAELELNTSIQINEKAEYMSLIRENEMRKLLKQRHLDLDYQEQPPYIIHKD